MRCPALRSTRRGWNVFLAPDAGAAGGGAADPTKPEIPDPVVAPLDYKALLLSTLGLAPEATDEEITSKQGEVSGTLGTVGELQTQASNAATLQTQLDEISGKYAELNKQQEEIFRQKQEADADEILKVYEGVFTDDASKAAIRNILLTDKDAGIAILNGLKKPEAASEAPAAAPEAGALPPKPMHDPKAADATAPSEDEIAAKIKAKAAEIRAKDKGISLSKAYQLAERDVRNVSQ